MQCVQTSIEVIITMLVKYPGLAIDFSPGVPVQERRAAHTGSRKIAVVYKNVSNPENLRDYRIYKRWKVEPLLRDLPHFHLNT